MISLREAASDLLNVVDFAIQSGAWKVNLGCDPFLQTLRLASALEKPEKEWVGLTTDEIWKCNKAKTGSVVEFHICSAHQNVMDFAKAIEAKVKEKNT